MLKAILSFCQARLRNVVGPQPVIETANPRRPGLFLGISLVFYFAYLSVMQPSWLLSGAMWAEMATNYFVNANASSLWQQLLATDAGYIPLPQRLIALLGHGLHLSAAVTPYFYTYSGLLLTSLLVGSFCLKPFRALVPSDALRLVTVIAVLMTVDFETRTFINCTYFGVFFIAMITALAWVDRQHASPSWAWCIPILMLSKPAVLTILPAMIVVAFVSQAWFRWITLVSLGVCLGQLGQMYLSQARGTFHQIHQFSLASKIMATGQYFFGFIANYTLPLLQRMHIHPQSLVLLGLAFFSASLYGLWRRKSSANALILIGFSLIFFNVLLNSFALSDDWNLNLDHLVHLQVYRHILVAFFGCVFVVVGTMTSLTEPRGAIDQTRHWVWLPVLGFILWFIASGWFSMAILISREHVYSTNSYYSLWQDLTADIDAKRTPLCVPIAPLGWVYGNQCQLLNSELKSMRKYHFALPTLALALTPPSDLVASRLHAFALLLKPVSDQATLVSAIATIHLKNGAQLDYQGQRTLNNNDGLIQFSGNNSVAWQNIRDIELRFNAPVQIAVKDSDTTAAPVVLWLGE